ncbi:type I secretion system permease/ATPase [Microvirga tunisiensis]|uniref:Type I secretion system permease/ATPase n=1 Tax=Microvirga tunisiensis TaxID=2108360 RepID=A0A5N7MSC9_9HYPH|nr:type I secretion system permease/ATPase [Microvirga tunisiensis]MPR08701.1 type I secretion system permease/ATPase [Microvirga tunisiensis]MPR26906.1 type I secretion system permease/ATPase [Microvirga tunisiensis]
MSKNTPHTYKDNDVAAAMRACRQHFLFAFVFNSFVNVLLLAYPVFMIQVFDRVIPAKSWETLVALLIGLTVAVCAKAVFQWVSGALLVRASIRIERRLADRLFKVVVRRSANGTGPAGAHLIRDLDSYRQFVTGKGALAAIDIPWGFLFIGVLVAIDPLIGFVAGLCLAISAGATIANSILTKRALIKANVIGHSSQQFSDAAARSAEAVIGLGMLDMVVGRWRSERNKALQEQLIASGRGVTLSAFLGSSRVLMQGILMGVGAIQVISGEVPTGIVFAAIIIFGFAMKPIDQIIGAWQDYHPVKEAMRRIDAALTHVAEPATNLRLPRPAGTITCQDLTFVPSGSDRPVLKRINFGVRAGESLGLVGLNGSGKTTLARILTGSLRPTSGTVRLDGAELDQWSNGEFGQFVGYLPQSVSLLPGTVADNIGRFGTFSDDAIIEAAKRARVHDLILRLPKGYETPLDNNSMLSGGQRQLIALARAVIGNPSIVILDEPNSNLDGPGEEALVSCMRDLKERGTTVILITHRPNLVVHLDHAAVLKEGMLVSFGSTTEVFKQLGRPTIVKTVGQRHE